MINVIDIRESDKRPQPWRKLSVLLLAWCLILLCCWQVQASEKVFKDLPPKLHTALGKAEDFAAKGQFSRAAQHLSTFATSNPTIQHPLLSYELGYFYFYAKNTNQALIHAQKAVQAAPDYKNAWQLIAHSYQEKGALFDPTKKGELEKKNKAMQKGARAMERAIALESNPDLIYQSGLLWLGANKPKRALAIFQGLTTRKNPKEEWFLGLSDCLKVLKRHVETAETIEIAALLNNDPALLFHASYLWYELEKPKRAEPLLKILLSNNKPDKSWLLLAVSVYDSLEKPAQAATAMEKVIEIDPANDFIFNCGLLWLQADNPDNSLKSLLRLEEVRPAQADWFVAITQAWILIDNIPKAADAMERAAKISKKPDHYYQAGAMRVQLTQPSQAIKLLSRLADHPKPKRDWMITIAKAWILKNNYLNGAKYMEMAAIISDEGKLYHQAAILYRQENSLDKALLLLKKSVARKKVDQLWLVDLGSMLIDRDEEIEVVRVMNRTNLLDKKVSNQLRYRGVLIWLNLQSPEKAYPLLKLLSNETKPRYTWLSAMVKTCVELGKYQQGDKVLQKTINFFSEEVKVWKLATWFALQENDYIKAVAAKEVVRMFEPNNKKHMQDLSRLYFLAGVPEQSARVFKDAMAIKPSIEETKHLLDIYLSGRMYDRALKHAKKIAEKSGVSTDLEVVGDIYYALHQYGQGADTYEKATAGEENPNLTIKAAYSAMKDDQYVRARHFFERAIELSGKKGEMGEQLEMAVQSLDYVNSKIEMKSKMKKHDQSAMTRNKKGELPWREMGKYRFQVTNHPASPPRR